MSIYLLTLYTHSQPIFPLLTEFEAGSHSEARSIRDRELNQRKQAIRNYALRCKEPTRKAEILMQMSFLHANVEILK